MGFLDGLKRDAIGGVAAHAAKSSHDHATGNVRLAWNFADGFKGFFVLIGFVLKSLYPDWPLWYAVDAVVHALGWDKEVPLIDFNTVATLVAAGVPLVHFAVKRWKEWKAGIPVADLGRSPLDQSVTIVTPATRMVVNATAEPVRVMPGGATVETRTPVEVSRA